MNPHLKCAACPNRWRGGEDGPPLVPVPRPRGPRGPSLFAKVGGNPSGAPGFAVTVGVRGTF